MYYPAEKLAQFPWIVSSGTLRLQDLLNANIEALERLERIRPGVKLEPTGQSLREFLDCVESAATVAKCLDGHWSEPCADIPPSALERIDAAVEDTAEALERLAPSGFYFGASEGDGACFGFWLDPDWCDAMDHLGFGNDDPTGWAELIGQLIADGIEPDSIEDSYQGRAEGWNEQHAGADYAQQLAQDAWLPDGPNGVGWNRWPVSCIDWSAAWEELRIGDGYRLHDIGGGEWLVFRDV